MCKYRKRRKIWFYPVLFRILNLIVNPNCYISNSDLPTNEFCRLITLFQGIILRWYLYRSSRQVVNFLLEFRSSSWSRDETRRLTYYFERVGGGKRRRKDGEEPTLQLAFIEGQREGYTTGLSMLYTHESCDSKVAQGAHRLATAGRELEAWTRLGTLRATIGRC